jgi:hypothetical protein
VSRVTRLARLEREVDLLLRKLGEVEKDLQLTGRARFCLDCFKVLDDEEWISHESSHLIITSNIDHNGVWEWLRCLGWVKKKIGEVKKR